MSQARVKLTDAMVASAEKPADKTEAVLWDAEVTGFGLRVREKTKTYVVVYRPPGAGRATTPRRIRLGTTGTIGSVKEARRLALATLGKIAGGTDPAAVRAEEKRQEKAIVSTLLDRYERHLTRRGYVNVKTLLSLLRRRLAPFAKRDIATIKGWEYAALFEKLEDQGKPAAATTFRSRCSTFLNWCTFEARVLDVNPLAGYRRGRDTRVERVAKAQTGRALPDAELAAVWREADPETTFGRLVRFLILTGCRRSEGAKLLRTMIDPARRRIDLPNTFTKQARGHTVYISDALAAVLDACAVDARNPDLVFASPRNGGHLRGWTQFMDPAGIRKTKGKGQRPAKLGLVGASGVNFTLHDLRRTFRTGPARLGVDRDIAELALGHARADLESRYNRDDCEAALREAFQKWGEHVAMIARPVG